MKVAITGSRGDIARALAVELARGNTATVLFPAGDVLDLTGPIEPVVAWLDHERPDALVHLAGAAPPRPLADLFAVNVGGTYILLSALARCTFRANVIIASSAAVYGQAPRQAPITETEPPNPCNAYGAAKLAQEQLAAAIGCRPARALTIARIFNTCGPSTRRDLGLPRLATRLAASPTGTIVAIPGGHAVRDYVDVRDVASALRTLLHTAAPPPVVNVGTGNGTTLLQIAERMCTHLAKRLILEACEEPTHPTGRLSEHIAYSVADITLLRSLGWEPRYHVDDALAELLVSDRPPHLSTT